MKVMNCIEKAIRFNEFFLLSYYRVYRKLKYKKKLPEIFSFIEIFKLMQWREFLVNYKLDETFFFEYKLVRYKEFSYN